MSLSHKQLIALHHVAKRQYFAESGFARPCQNLHAKGLIRSTPGPDYVWELTPAGEELARLMFGGYVLIEQQPVPTNLRLKSSTRPAAEIGAAAA